MSPRSLRIPRTLAAWPWPRAINANYLEVKAESSAWLENFKPFTPKAQTSFNKCDFNLLASLAYPLASRDEYTDAGDEVHASMIANVTMDAIRNPFKARPKGESIVGEIARQFWARTFGISNKTSIQRFIDTFDAYLQSVVIQAQDRSKSHFRDIEDYFDMRRDNIGAKPSFAILELGLDIPGFVMEHPSIRAMTLSAIDMLIIGNDLCSFKVEHARGDDMHNILTIAKHQFGKDLEYAVQWADAHHRMLRGKFLSALEEVPSWGAEVDEQVSQYLYGLANWVRANDSWSFESQRYFGERGKEIQRHRSVELDCAHSGCVMELSDREENLENTPRPLHHSRKYPNLLGTAIKDLVFNSPAGYLCHAGSLGSRIFYVAVLSGLLLFWGKSA
ncbi:hypothetical protein NP233_g10539 [Leucocoprinus birnbaumii]|uniref:Terpene synthase n=1 Tax=Leucocoprinus birnbaumii TaxID=56174 RepID=A0AAD5YRT5_9AGAR|nr:hypothetical protein NP233_g10539 [Leucocoprinus birnbaumii]